MMLENMKDKTEDYWREKLTPEQFRIVREKGTETPGTGELLNNHESGAYNRVACWAALFSGETKCESGSGGPSFYDVAKVGTGGTGGTGRNYYGGAGARSVGGSRKTVHGAGCVRFWSSSMRRPLRIRKWT